MPITATAVPDAATALDLAGTFLRTDPVRHNVILSVLSEPEPTDTAVVVHDDDDIVGVALISRNRTTVSLSPLPTEAMPKLTETCAQFTHLQQVTGPAKTAKRFVAEWTTRLGRSASPTMEQLLYEAQRLVTAPPPARGRYRVATSRDLDTLLAMETARVDPETDAEKIANIRVLLDARIADRQIRVWDADGTIVSKVRHSPPIAGATRLSAVYTPERHRRFGYSAAVVGTLTQELLDAGLRPLLYTDRSYIPANRLYTNLGYAVIDAYTDYALADR